MSLATQSGPLVEPNDILIMQLFPHLLLQVEVMVNVEDQPFPLLVVVVVRVLLVTFRDVAIGTHLGKAEGSAGRDTEGRGSEMKSYTAPKQVEAQDRAAGQGCLPVALHGHPKWTRLQKEASESLISSQMPPWEA